MTQTNTRSNLLGRATPVVNPRHQADIDSVEAHDQRQADPADPSVAVVKPVEPTHNWQKRYTDLQSYNSKKMNELQLTIDNLQKQGVQPLTVPKTAEEMQAMKQADPEGYARIESIASNMVQSQMGAYDQKLADITGDLNTTKIANAELEIKKAHPDFDAIVADDKFHEWAGRQESMVQDWVYNNPDNPQAAIRAINLYKFESGLGSNTASPANPQVNLEAPSGGDVDVNIKASTQTEQGVDRNNPTYIWTESEIGKMRPDEFGAWEQHISMAQREGRVAFGQ